MAKNTLYHQKNEDLDLEYLWALIGLIEFAEREEDKQILLDQIPRLLELFTTTLAESIVEVCSEVYAALFRRFPELAHHDSVHLITKLAFQRWLPTDKRTAIARGTFER